jgi:hypothetical protein
LIFLNEFVSGVPVGADRDPPEAAVFAGHFNALTAELSGLILDAESHSIMSFANAELAAAQR